MDKQKPKIRPTRRHITEPLPEKSQQTEKIPTKRNITMVKRTLDDIVNLNSNNDFVEKISVSAEKGVQTDKQPEYNIHPQLKEILQYLADNEHVYMVNNTNRDLESKILSLEEKLTGQIEELKQDKNKDDFSSLVELTNKLTEKLEVLAQQVSITNQQLLEVTTTVKALEPIIEVKAEKTEPVPQPTFMSLGVNTNYIRTAIETKAPEPVTTAETKAPEPPTTVETKSPEPTTMVETKSPEPPQPATRVQTKSPATTVQTKPPAPATTVETKPPAPATTVQTKPPQSATTVQTKPPQPTATIQVKDVVEEKLSEPDPQPITREKELKKLIESFQTKSTSQKGIDTLNNVVSATYIYNYSGKGSRYVNKLKSLGINNCRLSNPKIPNNCKNHLKAIYYIKDIINDARAHQYGKINIIADVVLYHKNIAKIFHHLADCLEQDWLMLQYCCIDHKHKDTKIPFNWQFYLDTNEDIKNIASETDAILHWETSGCKVGRVPGYLSCETQSHNTLAFALSSKVYDILEERLNVILDSDVEKSKKMGIFDGIHRNVIVPNIFILPQTGTAVAKSFKWYKPNYIMF